MARKRKKTKAKENKKALWFAMVLVTLATAISVALSEAIDFND